MEQNSALDRVIRIEGTLLMLDNTTPHVAVPVQAIRYGEVIATTLMVLCGSGQPRVWPPNSYGIWSGDGHMDQKGRYARGKWSFGKR